MIPKLLRHRWVIPALCSVGAFLAGHIAFHPGWRKAAALSDGSAGSFARMAARLAAADLLANASPQERVGWLLEICRQPDGLARDHALYEAIQRMQPGDFLAGLADLPAFGREMEAMGNQARWGLIEASVERWLEVDKNAALSWLAASRAIVESGAIALPMMGHDDAVALSRMLGKRAPEWLRGQLEHLGEKTGRKYALRTLMSAEANHDPRKAREWLETFRGGKEWAEAFGAYVDGLHRSNPRAALELALAEDGAETRGGVDSVLADLLASTLAHMPSLAGEFLPKLDPDARRLVMRFAVIYLGESGADPFVWFADRFAADPALLDLGANPEEAAEQMRLLVGRNPLRTLEFITTLPEAQQGALRQGALESWSSYRPDTFLDWLATQPPETAPKDFKRMGMVARQEPERFARWTETLPAGELRERSQLALASELAKQGRGAEALRHFPQNATSDGAAKSTRELAGTLAASEPTATAQWVRTLPAGAARAEAARGLIGTWAGQAPQEAAQWVVGLPAGATRDAATGALAGVLANADPVAATEWVGQIGNPTARDSAVRQVFQSWSRSDPAGAREWLRAFPDVSEAVKGRLLRSRR